MRIFSSAENCRRVARDIFHHWFCRRFVRPGFLSHLRALISYDEPEIFPLQMTRFCLTSADGGQGRVEAGKELGAFQDRKHRSFAPD